MMAVQLPVSKLCNENVIIYQPKVVFFCNPKLLTFTAIFYDNIDKYRTLAAKCGVLLAGANGTMAQNIGFIRSL